MWEIKSSWHSSKLNRRRSTLGKVPSCSAEQREGYPSSLSWGAGLWRRPRWLASIQIIENYNSNQNQGRLGTWVRSALVALGCHCHSAVLNDCSTAGISIKEIWIKTSNVEYAESMCGVVLSICDKNNNCCRTSNKGRGLDRPGLDRRYGATDIYNTAVLGGTRQRDEMFGDCAEVGVQDCSYRYWYRIISKYTHLVRSCSWKPESENCLHARNCVQCHCTNARRMSMGLTLSSVYFIFPRNISLSICVLY